MRNGHSLGAQRNPYFSQVGIKTRLGPKLEWWESHQGWRSTATGLSQSTRPHGGILVANRYPVNAAAFSETILLTASILRSYHEPENDALDFSWNSPKKAKSYAGLDESGDVGMRKHCIYGTGRLHRLRPLQRWFLPDALAHPTRRHPNRRSKVSNNRCSRLSSPFATSYQASARAT